MSQPPAPNNFVVEDLARFSDDQPSTRDSASLVCRRHNVFARGTLRGSRERVSNVGHFLKLLESLPQSRQIHSSDLRDVGRGGSAMLGYSGHTT